MSFDWSNLISSGFGLLSGGLNFGSSARSAKKAYQYALDLQNRQNSWMERMSNTAHQREVADLRAAGLNPILSATGGSGASSPQAGSASSTPVTPDLGSAISTALDYKRYKNEKELKNSNIGLNDSLTSKAYYEGDLAHHSAAKAREETQLLQQYGPLLKQLEALSFKSNIANNNAVTAATVKKINAETNYYNSQTNLSSTSAKSAKRDYDWYNSNPKWYNTSRATASLGNIFAGVGTALIRK